MNPSEYAKRYHRSNRKQVQKWLDEGRIRGAVLSEDGWDIPEGAKVEFRPSPLRKRKDTVDDNIIDILKAIYGNWFVDAEVIGLSNSDYRDRVALLKELDLVTDSDSPYDGVASTGLRLTSRGLQDAPKNRGVILDLYQRTMAALVEGSIRSQNP